MVNSEKTEKLSIDKDSLIKFFKSSCNMSLPCSKILACLVIENKPLDVKSISEKVEKIPARKIYSHLNELIRQSLVKKVESYPTHYQSIPLNDVVEILTLSRKRELEFQMKSIVEEAEKIKKGIPIQNKELSFLKTPALLYTTFCELLNSLASGEEMIVETKSSLILAVPQYEFETMLEDSEYKAYSLTFRNLLYERLKKGELIAKYICDIDSFSENLIDKRHILHRLKRLQTLKKNVEDLAPNFQIVSTNMRPIGLPATTVFDRTAVVFSFREVVIGKLRKYSTDRLIGGLLMKSPIITETFHKILNEYFEKIKLENISNYLKKRNVKKNVNTLDKNEQLQYLLESIKDKIDKVIKRLEEKKK